MHVRPLELLKGRHERRVVEVRRVVVDSRRRRLETPGEVQPERTEVAHPRPCDASGRWTTPRCESINSSVSRLTRKFELIAPVASERAPVPRSIFHTTTPWVKPSGSGGPSRVPAPTLLNSSVL